MGRDKALLTIDGETLLERTARVALAVSPHVLAIGRHRPGDWTQPELSFLPDDLPERGPLGGLATALRHATTPILLLACDMPAITSDALRWLMEAYADVDRSGNANSGIAVRNNDRIEPLFSVYSPSLLPAIERQIENGNLALRDLIASSGFTIRDVPTAYAAQLVNVNTQREWEEITGRAG